MRRVMKLVPVQLVSVLAVIIAAVIVFSVLSPGFTDPGNLRNLLLQSSATAIAAAGMTFVIIGGWIDLSIGSLMSLAVAISLALSGVTSAATGSSSVWTYIFILGIALLGGALNGLLIRLLDVHPLLVTLGTMAIFGGLSLRLTSAGDRAASGPIQALGRGTLWGIPLPVIVAVAVIIGLTFVLRRTTFGRHVTAIGGSSRSALETALPVTRVRTLVFALSGLTAGLAGVITVGQVGTMQSTFGSGFEFTVITAVVVGGASLSGGKGSVVGSALGAVLLTLIENGLNRINASIYIYDVITALVLLTAVLTDSVVLARVNRARALVSRRIGRAQPAKGNSVVPAIAIKGDQ